MKNKISSNKYVIIIFILLFLLSLFNLSKITGGWDLISEQDIVLANIKEYGKNLNSEELVTFLHDEGIIEISENEDRDHGVALFYLATPIIFLRYALPELSANLWNLYVFIIFFIGSIYFYKLMYMMYKNKKVAIIMTLLYYLSPRIFVDSLHNNKDVTLLSMLVIDTCLLARVIKTNNNKDMIKFAIASAFLCNIKIIGMFFVFILGITYLLYKIINKQINQQLFVDVAFIILLAFGIYFIITPAIWGSGKIHLISFIKYCLNRDSKFPWQGIVYFEGQKYIGILKPLPLYYLPKSMIITLPILIPLLFITSFATISFDLLRKFIKKKKNVINDYIFTASLINFIIPFALYFILKPNIYNFWRHFYFLYAPIMIISSYIVNKLYTAKKTVMKAIIITMCVISLVSSSYSILKYGVKNEAYFNLLLGNKDISNRYEMDPYTVTTKDAFVSFTKHMNIADTDKVYLYTLDKRFMNAVIIARFQQQNFSAANRIILVTKDNLKEYITEGKHIYIFSNTAYDFNKKIKYKLVYSYKIKNSPIINFYRYN